MCSDTDRYKWCIKMVPRNPEHTLLLLSAPSKGIQEVGTVSLIKKMTLYFVLLSRQRTNVCLRILSY